MENDALMIYDDLPVKHDDFPVRYVKLPRGYIGKQNFYIFIPLKVENFWQVKPPDAYFFGRFFSEVNGWHHMPSVNMCDI